MNQRDKKPLKKLFFERLKDAISEKKIGYAKRFSFGKIKLKVEPLPGSD